jgi:hypothetical protein
VLLIDLIVAGHAMHASLHPSSPTSGRPG